MTLGRLLAIAITGAGMWLMAIAVGLELPLFVLGPRYAEFSVVRYLFAILMLGAFLIGIGGGCLIMGYLRDVD